MTNKAVSPAIHLEAACFVMNSSFTYKCNEIKRRTWNEVRTWRKKRNRRNEQQRNQSNGKNK